MPYIVSVKKEFPPSEPGKPTAADCEIYRQTIDEEQFNLRTFIVALNPAPARTRKPRQAKGTA